MSKRLQVLVPEEEMSDIQRLARQDHLTVGEWVRQALRKASQELPATAADTKVAAIRRGAGYSFPTADIEQMLAETELGYRG